MPLAARICEPDGGKTPRNGLEKALDEAASPRDGGSGLGGLRDWEEAGRREILV